MSDGDFEHGGRHLRHLDDIAQLRLVDRQVTTTGAILATYVLGESGAMTGRTPVAEQPLVPGDTTPWATASARLETPEKDRTHWLATVRPDGRLHVRPILGLWLDDAFYFITGETTRKAKNLHANPQCVLTASSLALPALDVIIEGKASKVTDHTKVQQWSTPTPPGCTGR